MKPPEVMHFCRTGAMKDSEIELSSISLWIRIVKVLGIKISSIFPDTKYLFNMRVSSSLNGQDIKINVLHPGHPVEHHFLLILG